MVAAAAGASTLAAIVAEAEEDSTLRGIAAEVELMATSIVAATSIR
jgi:hypothetical protein